MIADFNKILLIDDDDSLNKVIAYQLQQMGYDVSSAEDGTSGLSLFKENTFDIVLTDLQLPDIDGMEILSQIRQIDKDVIVIIITAYGTVENAVEASHSGADDYITKPFGKESLRFTIEKAVQLRRLKMENQQLRGELFDRYDFSNLIGGSAAMENVLKLTGRVAESDATVLVQGESGTGKELIARAIHYNSPRKDKPFVTVNCPSIPETLIESELFGHVRGAYTGATTDRKGKFQLARNGTIFLDEIGDLKLDLQAKLLRVIQEREIERVGESSPTKIDVRVIAATNRDLEQMVAEGNFREDLYYRLNVVTIFIPPLRDRKEDLPFLIDHFLGKHGKGTAYSLSERVSDIFLQYNWPGNVRELENTIERCLIIETDNTIMVDSLPDRIRNLSPSRVQAQESGDSLTLEQLERNAILNALKKSGGNQTQAAKLLDIPRHVLLYRMKKFNIG